MYGYLQIRTEKQLVSHNALHIVAGFGYHDGA